MALAQAESAHNSVVHLTTGKAPFSIIYTKESRQALDLIKLPVGHGANNVVKNMAEQWQKMTEEVKQKIEQSNAKYKAATDKH